ncbi:MAG: glycosyltransferase [Dermatophilaceae bacterium]
MTAAPSVSVVIAAHNARQTIGMALTSLFAQTVRSWEAIVVDDGSSDGTRRVVDALADERIHVVTQSRAGAAAARNRGLSFARGDFIAFLDADDFLFPEYFERSLAVLAASSDKTLVTNNAYFLTRSGLDIRLMRHRFALPRSLERQQDALLRSNFASIMSVFPRELLDDVTGFDVDLERAEDWDFWIRASFAGWFFAHQRSPMAFINRTGESLTSATDKVARSEAEVLRKAARTQPLTASQAKRIESRLATGEPSTLWSDSVSALEAGDYVRAARLHWTGTRMATRAPGPLARALAFRLAPRTVGTIRRRRLRPH